MPLFQAFPEVCPDLHHQGITTNRTTFKGFSWNLLSESFTLTPLDHPGNWNQHFLALWRLLLVRWVSWFSALLPTVLKYSHHKARVVARPCRWGVSDTVSPWCQTADHGTSHLTHEPGDFASHPWTTGPRLSPLDQGTSHLTLGPRDLASHSWTTGHSSFSWSPKQILLSIWKMWGHFFPRNNFFRA